MPRAANKPQELCRHKSLSLGRFDARSWYVGRMVSDGKGGERLDETDAHYFVNPYEAAKGMLKLLPNEAPLAASLEEFAGRLERAWAKAVRELKGLEGAK